MTTWIDFKAVKEAARFEPILERYGIELRRKGKELVGLCPFHEEVKPSFSVNTEKRVFHCFGCGAKGNVLDFVARKEGVTIRKAGELVSEWFEVPDAERPHKSGRTRNASPVLGGRTQNAVPSSLLPPREEELQDLKPLGFSLRVDPDHPYIASRGVTRELAGFFGLGFCSRGMLKDHIAIPLHNERAELVGYIGRWAGDEVPEDKERYKLPPAFPKSRVLYNVHRVIGSDHLVLVESCWSVFRLHALGVPAVALLGRSLSPEQEELLSQSHARRLTLLFDGDEPGRQAAVEVIPRLARRFFVRVADLPQDTQPDSASEETLQALLDL